MSVIEYIYIDIGLTDLVSRIGLFSQAITLHMKRGKWCLLSVTKAEVCWTNIVLAALQRDLDSEQVKVWYIICKKSTSI